MQPSGWVMHPPHLTLSTGVKGIWGFAQAGGGAEITQPIKVGELNDIFMACSSKGLTAIPNYLSPAPTQPQIKAELCIHTKKWPSPVNRGRLVDSCEGMLHSPSDLGAHTNIPKQHLIICYMWVRHVLTAVYIGFFSLRAPEIKFLSHPTVHLCPTFHK